jgi:hypothetical protein
MKNTFKKLFLFLFIAGVTVSCDLGPDKELDYGSGAFVAQFHEAEKTALFLKDDAVVYPYEIPVELVGGNGLAINKDINLSFEVDLVNSTAVEGVHFDFVNPTNTLVIASGNTFSTIKITVNSGNLDDQNPPVLVLKLTAVNAEGVEVLASGNKSTIALTLQGQCSSDLGGMYNLVTTRLDNGLTYVLPNEEVAETAPGEYLTSSTGPYNNRGLISAGAQITNGPSAGFFFNEVCGRIALKTGQRLGGQLGGGYSNAVFQTPAQYAVSSVNPVTGVITIEYSVFFAAGDRQYRGVYTPQ